MSVSPKEPPTEALVLALIAARPRSAAPETSSPIPQSSLTEVLTVRSSDWVLVYFDWKPHSLGSL